MEQSHSARGRQWDVLVGALLALIASAVFLGWRLGTPSDCAWLPPQPGSFSAGGVVPLVREGCPLPGGTLVTAATEDGGRVLYTTEPGSRIVETPLSRDRGGSRCDSGTRAAPSCS